MFTMESCIPRPIIGMITNSDEQTGKRDFPFPLITAHEATGYL